MSKPSYTPTFIATARLFEVHHSLLPYRRFISYPVYILISEGGELKGCTLTDTTEIGKGRDDGNGDGDGIGIDSDLVEQINDEVVKNNIPEIESFYPLAPKIV